ncbi:hypothetical protein C8Q74DRAFT_680875 [Fomes fomentarius]|nr:hypothetical protein C8Q74DRAFT_680875 [Fomes fomentarius]
MLQALLCPPTRRVQASCRFIRPWVMLKVLLCPPTRRVQASCRFIRPWVMLKVNSLPSHHCSKLLTVNGCYCAHRQGGSRQVFASFRDYQILMLEMTERRAEFRADLDFRDDGDREGDPNAAHVIRYISTLALPLSASRALMQSIAKYRDANVQLSMSFLNATDSQTIEFAVVQKLKTALINLVRPSGTASVEKLFQAYWSLAKEDKKFKVSIHAEAALMGAVFSHISGAPNASTIRIGVSKKCCFCCRLLGEELNDWRKFKLKGSDGDTACPEFILPGSHSTVFPWAPPRGVPLEVRKNIRVELLKRLWELIQEGMYAKSAQTSPARSERSLVVDYSPRLNLYEVWDEYDAASSQGDHPHP